MTLFYNLIGFNLENIILNYIFYYQLSIKWWLPDAKTYLNILKNCEPRYKYLQNLIVAFYFFVIPFSDPNFVTLGSPPEVHPFLPSNIRSVA